MTVDSNFSEKIRQFDAGNPLFVVSFSVLAKVINESGLFKTVKQHFHEADLADIICKLELYVEKRYGRNSTKPRAFTKLPFKLYRDTSCNGSVHLILAAVLSEMKQRSLHVIDELLTLDDKHLLVMLRNIEQQLHNAGVLKKKAIYLSKTRLLDKQLLKDIIVSHGAEVAATEESATHVVEWNDEVDNFPSILAEDFVRILEIKSQSDDADLTLVHWWYHPDCYDEWIHNSDVNNLEPPDVGFTTIDCDKKTWNVCCRFILDCEFFNEWGNEADYENDVEDDGFVDGTTYDSELALSNSGRKSRGRKKQQLIVNSSRVQKDTSVIPEAITATAKMMNERQPPLGDKTQQQLRILDLSSNAEGDKSSIIEKQLIGEKRALESIKIESSAEAVTGSLMHKTILEKDVAPEWFRFDAVSDFEVSFLAASSRSNVLVPPTCQLKDTYLSVRNSMINLYKTSRTQYLSATECRRKLAADISLVLRTHELLNAFGVINHSVRSDDAPNSDKTVDMLRAVLIDSNDLSDNKRLKSWHHSEPFLTDKGTFRWTRVLVERLKQAVQAHFGDWTKIAAEVGEGATSAICISKFAALELSCHSRATADDDDAMRIANESQLCAKENIKLMYLDTRFKILEEKMQLLADVEALVDSELERLQVERRDVQVQRAQLAVIQQSGAKPLA